MAEAQLPARATARTTVITLPHEIDMANANRVGADLQAAFAPGVTVVVADMTGTTFCDSRGIRTLVLARKQAAASGAELRLVVRSAGVLRVLGLLGLEGWLAIYPSLQEALAAEPAAKSVVVRFPAECDSSSAGDVAVQLRAAIAPGGSAVVADLTATDFCDSSGLRVVLLARDWATADHVELRLAVPPGPTLVVLKLVGLDEMVPIYPTLDEALAAEPTPDAAAPHGQAVPEGSA
jgi:anti-sigma B factor antagonist